MTTTIKTAAVLAALIWMFVPPALYADDDGWTLRRQDSKYDIEVYQRTTAEGYTEFRGVTHINSRLSAFVALLRDVDNMPNWIYRTNEVRVVEILSDTESYVQTINNMPWPVRDRDAIVFAKLEQNPATQAITLRATADPGFAPADDRYVRMPLLESSWTFTPLADGRTRVVFRCYADPGGKLTSGIFLKFQAMLAWHAPYKTLRAMRQVILDPEYQAATLAFIREPAIWNTARNLTSVADN